MSILKKIIGMPPRRFDIEALESKLPKVFTPEVPISTTRVLKLLKYFTAIILVSSFIILSPIISIAQMQRRLCDAIHDGESILVINLVESGADVNHCDWWAETPLDLAAGNFEIAKYLIDKGADVNGKSIFKGTPIMSAASKGNIPLMRLLIEKGADVNAAAESGFTALMHASEGSFLEGKGHLEAVKILLDNGADVNAKDMGGDTALIYAVKTGPENSEIVQLLINKGADKNAKNKEGETVLSFAKDQRTTDILRGYKKLPSENTRSDNDKSPTYSDTNNPFDLLIEEFLEAQLRGKNRSYILSFPDLIGESRKH